MSLEPKNGLRLNEALQREVDELARRTGDPPLAIVGKALELLKGELDSKEANGTVKTGGTSPPNIYERWENARLIGCAKGLPSDLSTAPKHMEGFGRD